MWVQVDRFEMTMPSLSLSVCRSMGWLLRLTGHEVCLREELLRLVCWTLACYIRGKVISDLRAGLCRVGGRDGSSAFVMRMRCWSF